VNAVQIRNHRRDDESIGIWVLEDYAGQDGSWSMQSMRCRCLEHALEALGTLTPSGYMQFIWNMTWSSWLQAS